MTEIPEKVARLRQERGLTLAQLAALTKVSAVTIYNIERGVYEPRISTLLELCRALVVPLSYFIDTSEEFLFHKSKNGVPPDRKSSRSSQVDFPYIIRCNLETGANRTLPVSAGALAVIFLVFGELGCSCGSRKSRLLPNDTLYVELFDTLKIKSYKPSLFLLLGYSANLKLE